MPVVTIRPDILVHSSRGWLEIGEVGYQACISNSGLCAEMQQFALPRFSLQFSTASHWCSDEARVT